MACNNCYNSSCDSTCGCPQQVKGSCVFYQGANLTCLDVTKGDDYDSILANLNTRICNLVPPSGNTTVVTSNACSGGNNILVTSSTVGSTTTYNVCLNPTIVTNINNNTANIAALSACASGLVSNITTSTPGLTITPGSATACGRPFTIDYTPTSVPVVDGIIYSDTTKNGTIALVGFDEVLKDSSTSIGSYYTANGLEVGDEIRWRANGQIKGISAEADDVKFDFFDGVTGILNGNTFGGFSTTGLTSSWEMEGTAIVIDNTPGAAQVLIDVKLLRYQLPNGNVGNTTRDLYVFNQTISNIDLSTLKIRIKYYRKANGVSPVDNFARQLVVEIRKKI